LSTISASHHAYGISTFDSESGLLVGRPYGGLAILWDKSLPSSAWANENKSIIGLSLRLENLSLTFINAYLPYCCQANTDVYLQYLSNLNTVCESIEDSSLCVIRDFNASECNMFGQVLSNFCAEYDYIVSDKSFLPADTFTYVSDCHGTVT